MCITIFLHCFVKYRNWTDWTDFIHLNFFSCATLGKWKHCLQDTMSRLNYISDWTYLGITLWSQTQKNTEWWRSSQRDATRRYPPDGHSLIILYVKAGLDDTLVQVSLYRIIYYNLLISFLFNLMCHMGTWKHCLWDTIKHRIVRSSQREATLYILSV